MLDIIPEGEYPAVPHFKKKVARDGTTRVTLALRRRPSELIRDSEITFPNFKDQLMGVLALAAMVTFVFSDMEPGWKSLLPVVTFMILLCVSVVIITELTLVVVLRRQVNKNFDSIGDGVLFNHDDCAEIFPESNNPVSDMILSLNSLRESAFYRKWMSNAVQSVLWANSGIEDGFYRAYCESGDFDPDLDDYTVFIGSQIRDREKTRELLEQIENDLKTVDSRRIAPKVTGSSND